MSQLGARDLSAALAFALEAHATDDLEVFRRELIPGLRRLVACDTLGYNEIDLERRAAVVLSDAPVFDGIDRRFLQLAHQHPMVSRQRAGDLAAYRISDFLSTREFHRLELYQDIYRRLGIEDQFAFGLPGEAIVAVNLGRGRRTFSERDRQVLELVRPHLARAYARARRTQRLAALREALEVGLEERHIGVVQLDPRGRVAQATPAARELLQAYCGHRPGRGTGLPGELETWLTATHRNQRPRQLSIEGARGLLIVSEQLARRPGGWSALILQERQPRPPSVEAIRALGLTDRQAQVLRLLAGRKTVRKIAHELGISPATVEKHLEHAYARLGVSSRTQALARVYGAAPASAGSPRRPRRRQAMRPAPYRAAPTDGLRESDLRATLALAYGRARELDRTRALIGALDSGLGERTGMLQFDDRLRVVHVTEVARELLDAYCEPAAVEANQLPARLRAWLTPMPVRRHGALRPLAIDGPRGRLHVRELPAGTHEEIRTLILHEQRASPPSLDALRALGLTERRAQALRLLAAGRTNHEIARELRISPATVEKHLEHVYRTLGVSSRAQALVRVYAPTGCQAVLSSITESRR
jgi:DNA-binding NarL/FixJ family response regulator